MRRHSSIVIKHSMAERSLPTGARSLTCRDNGTFVLPRPVAPIPGHLNVALSMKSAVLFVSSKTRPSPSKNEQLHAVHLVPCAVVAVTRPTHVRTRRASLTMKTSGEPLLPRATCPTHLRRNMNSFAASFGNSAVSPPKVAVSHQMPAGLLPLHNALITPHKA